MKQSKIEETIDESFNRLIDIMIKFPKNPYHINLEEIFFKGKADLIHKLEKIINQKDKQIDLMADNLVGMTFSDKENIEIIFDNKEDIKKYFERKVKDEN